MRDVVLLNGRLVAGGEAGVPLRSEGFQFGYGLFETLRVRDGRALRVAEHAARLARGAVDLGLEAGSVAAAAARMGRLLGAAEAREAALKWVLFRGEGERTAEALWTRPYPYTEDQFVRGFGLRTSPARGGLPWKTLAYLPHLLARRAAQGAGADEALLVDSAGLALEGAGTNLFIVERGHVLTPPLDGRILPGIARARVVQLAAAREEPLPVDRVLAADEVFVTNALVGVMPVARIDERSFPVDHHPFARELRRRFDADPAT